MKFEYKNNEFELMELTEPNQNITFDLIGIFKIKYVIITKELKKIEVSKTDNYDFIDYEYINYFCNQDDDNIATAKYYIDNHLRRKKSILNIFKKKGF